ncbi:hypothetical protein CDD83_3776 [Cordyceps sp. RAO-2017]|nr:hypothetical protein CDD83_3776 [Cordyceps sp. RAO-2017]
MLAAEIALGRVEAPGWAALVPSWPDLEAAVPFAWPEALREALPCEARRLVAAQEARFRRDWQLFEPAFPGTGRQQYAHAWFLVGTRTFYYETAETMLFPWSDRLALLPVADLFNHAPAGCLVSYSPDGYTVTADRPYPAGAELFISYGSHSNDFLLAEYGFLLRDNACDRVCLDDLILPKLPDDLKAELDERDVLGNFVLDPRSGICSRTRLAVRLLSCPPSQSRHEWQHLIDEAEHEDDEHVEASASRLLLTLLGEYLDTIDAIQTRLQKRRLGNDSQRALLAQRWRQIEAMVRQAAETGGRGGLKERHS